MSEGIKIRITSVPTSGPPILIPDVKDATDFAGYAEPGPFFVPVPGSIEIAYTSRVSVSLEEGGIKKLLDANLITVDFILSARFIGAVGGGGLSFVADETPSGSIDSANMTYTTAFLPAQFVGFYYNGQKLVGGGEDYTLTGSTIVLNFAPDPGDVLKVDYIR